MILSTQGTSIKYLVDHMTISKNELCKRADISYRTLERMARGDLVLRSSANKVLQELSKVYNEQYTIDNVSGLNITD